MVCNFEIKFCSIFVSPCSMQVSRANLGHPQLFVSCCQLYMLLHLNSSLLLAELPCHIATTTDSDSRPTQRRQSSKFAASHFVVAELLQSLGYIIIVSLKCCCYVHQTRFRKSDLWSDWIRLIHVISLIMQERREMY